MTHGLSWGVRHGFCFYPHLHKRMPGRHVDVRPPRRGRQKQLQVSVLPERRVKKRDRTALMGYLLGVGSNLALFFHLFRLITPGVIWSARVAVGPYVDCGRAEDEKSGYPSIGPAALNKKRHKRTGLRFKQGHCLTASCRIGRSGPHWTLPGRDPHAKRTDRRSVGRL